MHWCLYLFDALGYLTLSSTHVFRSFYAFHFGLIYATLALWYTLRLPRTLHDHWSSYVYYTTKMIVQFYPPDYAINFYYYLLLPPRLGLLDY